MERCGAETGAQIFLRMRSNAQPSLANLSPEMIPQRGPNRKEVIEIAGESNTGKTLHLMELIALTVIPDEYGGKGAAVIVIDNNSNFHVPNVLERIIEKHLLHHNMKTSMSTETEDLRAATEHVEETVFRALDRVHLFKCYSSNDFELAMLHVSMLLTDHSNISLIAIDSITSFYWSETKLIRMDNYVRQWLREIKKVNDEFGTVAVYTKLLHSSETPNYNDEFIQYRVELKANKEQTFEASTTYKEQAFSRRYTINTFGIDWMTSSS